MNKKLRVVSERSETETPRAKDTAAAPPTYWRSLAELDQTPEFRDAVEREFAEPLQELPPDSPGRRRFMQVMGASFSMAGLAGCRWHEDKILPMTRMRVFGSYVAPEVPRRREAMAMRHPRDKPRAKATRRARSTSAGPKLAATRERPVIDRSANRARSLTAHARGRCLPMAHPAPVQ